MRVRVCWDVCRHCYPDTCLQWWKGKSESATARGNKHNNGTRQAQATDQLGTVTAEPQEMSPHPAAACSPVIALAALAALAACALA